MGKVACPACGSTSSHLAEKEERPEVWFTIKSFRKCEGCGRVFEPPSGRALGGIVVLLGVCAMAAPLPGLIESLSPLRLCSLAFSFLTMLVCIYGGLQMVKQGLWALRARQRAGRAWRTGSW